MSLRQVGRSRGLLSSKNTCCACNPLQTSIFRGSTLMQHLDGANVVALLSGALDVTSRAPRDEGGSFVVALFDVPKYM